MPRILLTDGEQRSTLAATRSLGRGGHEVMVASAVPRPLAGASRFCHRACAIPDPSRDPAAFGTELTRICESEGVELILPMTDVSATVVLPLRPSLGETRIVFPDADAYAAVSDKQGLLAAAASLGVPVPAQLTLTTRAAALEMLEGGSVSLTFPQVLKPARSAVDGGQGVEKFGVSVAAGPEDLRSLLAQYPDSAYPILLQEQIRGAGLGAFALFWDGEPYAWFAHRRIREKPPTGGVSVYREGVELREDLKEYATRILRHFGWSGVAMVEFKEDAATGTPYLMEVNGRFWGSLQLAIDSGVDFPDLLVRLAMGDDVGPVTGFRPGVRSRWLWGDVDHVIALLRHGRRYRATHADLPGALGALGRFLVPWRPGDRFEVLRASDPRPFLRETAQWFGALRG
ncbi:MAG: ATP-grasp domain-containing protein [Longimicrobiales bacterium]|nr:ATP-grasp domain-containing protein [Longimicrobiales bacterium]